jgi:hypothetical protein
MVTNFEAGKWYRYDGHSKRIKWADSMADVLDGKPRLCTRGSGTDANFELLVKPWGYSCWSWSDGIENWYECEAPTSTTVGASVGKYKPGDRVVVTSDEPKGEVGTVVFGPRKTGSYLVEFDTWAEGHDGGGIEPGVKCKPEHGYWLHANQLAPIVRSSTPVPKLDVSGDYPADKMAEFVKSARLIAQNHGCDGIRCSNCPATAKLHRRISSCTEYGATGKNFATPWFAEWLRVYDEEPRFDSLYEVSGVKISPPVVIRESFSFATETRLNRAKRLLSSLRS